MKSCAAFLIASVFLITCAAAAQTLTEFPVGAGTIGGLATGPDGYLWFTETAANRIGRITPEGIINVFPIATAGSPGQITAAADNNMWFTEWGGIGRITLNGVITHFPLPYTGFAASPVSITSGPDGNIWYTEDISRVGRLTPDGVFKEFETGYNGLSGITGGPDGNIWFTTNASGESKICRIRPEGEITQFGSYGELGGPEQIIAGPDGSLWFTQLSPNLGRITTLGTITQYNVGTFGSSIVTWRGDLWLADGKRLLRITTDGVVRSPLALPPTADVITAMTTGPDGQLWLVEASGAIGRVAWQTPRRRAVQH